MLNDPDYASADRAVKDLGSQVETVKADVDTAQGTFESAHARREDVYTSYAEARDSNPQTAIVSEDMTPAQVNHLRSRRMRLDETLLSEGARPDFSLNAKCNVSEAEENDHQPLRARTVQAEIDRHRREQNPRIDDLSEGSSNLGITRGL